MRILVVEDEEAIRELIKLNLNLSGYDVVEAKDGLEGLNLIKSENFDLVLLDIMLPKLDGFEVLNHLKENDTPVICLSAKNGIQDRVKGLELGADDYLTKPFESLELLARIKAVLRRTKAEPSEQAHAKEVVCYRNIRLEPNQHRVYVDGQEVALTLKEYELLSFFIEHKGMVLTREQLLSQIWGYDYEGNTRTVDMHVQKLRTKLGCESIQTVYKVGYRLED